MDFKNLQRTALTFICEWFLVECSSRNEVAGSNPVEQILSG